MTATWHKSLRDAAGFTLVELLIAVTLLGLLTTVLAGGFRFGLRAWERGQTHGAGVDEVRLVQTALRRELQQAYPFFLTGEAAHARIDFHGKRDSLAFLGPPPQAMITGGLAKISILAETRGGKLRLLLEVQPELADGAAQKRDILIDNLRSVAFAYYGTQRTGDLPEWHDQWEDAARPPQLVRLEIAFSDGDTRTWPDFVVAPRISVDVACVFDLLTKYCKGR